MQYLLEILLGQRAQRALAGAARHDRRRAHAVLQQRVLAEEVAGAQHVHAAAAHHHVQLARLQEEHGVRRVTLAHDGAVRRVRAPRHAL